jgi:hypothetical protein
MMEKNLSHLASFSGDKKEISDTAKAQGIPWGVSSRKRREAEVCS